MLRRDRYLLIGGPPDFQAELLANAERGIPGNGELRVIPETARRGDLVSDVIGIVGFISSVGGLVTFVDWAITSWRARRSGENLSFRVIDEEGDVRVVQISSGDDGDDIRRKLTDALDSE